MLHHRHTSYRGLAVIFVLAGMAMAGITLVGRVAADSLVAVQGTEPTPVPTAAALIASPVEGTSIANGSVLVTGSCPIVSPQVVVLVTVDGTTAGSAACDSSNDFSLPISLSPGAHTLVPKILTIASQPGPDGTPVHIDSSAPQAASPIALAADTPFSYLGADKTAVWTGTISGGTPPYHVHIDWNDGQQITLDTTAGKQYFSHTYAALQSYDPLFSITDSGGNVMTRQFAVSAYTIAAPKASQASLDEALPASAVSASTLIGLYGLLLTAVSISGIIWLEAKHAARHAVAA